ncbi:hypothetical protein JTB14_006202 [Gonioctena quinquepunctata]|nr:hypothetical protein JTB14_006202 [Gonioctena quinquepunctata]
MKECHPNAIPADPNSLLYSEEINIECNAPYREAVGCLMFLAQITTTLARSPARMDHPRFRGRGFGPGGPPPPFGGREDHLCLEVDPQETHPRFQWPPNLEVPIWGRSSRGPPGHSGPPGAHNGPPGVHNGPPGTHNGPPGTHNAPPGTHNGPPPGLSVPHLVVLVGHHLVVLVGHHLEILVGPHLVTLGGLHLVTLVGRHLVTFSGPPPESGVPPPVGSGGPSSTSSGQSGPSAGANGTSQGQSSLPGGTGGAGGQEDKPDQEDQMDLGVQ